ncbi:hypothetical protein TSH7_10090 [Azospirillum sp. TSH7]|uniref:hypothetical protein n=1 Tax=unclassified Azospirillum TaxID=2630922 RepID=UPI000D6178CF|nr:MULTISPECIES: hypothetical protein [unclassified Azospirillum]PWC64016.1 hypothetical protein TSH20_19185 [Azospirillum sp. TSH20]PWC64879.1 hypothetical protein TSH7_10090 [Azospirillum sp. TSH7]
MIQPTGPVAYMLVPMQEARDKLVCCATGQVLSLGTGTPPPLKVVSPEIVELLVHGPGVSPIVTVQADELARLKAESASLENLWSLILAANQSGDRAPTQETWRKLLHAARRIRLSR